MGTLVRRMRFIHGQPPTVRVSGPASILQNARGSIDHRQKVRVATGGLLDAKCSSGDCVIASEAKQFRGNCYRRLLWIATAAKAASR
jgi:hypothetical protein